MRATDLPRRALLLAAGIVGLRKDDVLLASFPKSGNTWVRFVLAHLISVLEGSPPVELGFEQLNALMPECGRSNLLRPWHGDVLPRFVKTHLPYSPLFRANRQVLVVRDPWDVMRSLQDFEAGRIRPRVPATLEALVHHPRFGLEAWFRHTRSWLDRSPVLVRYEELHQDDVGTICRMLTECGHDTPKEAVAEACRRSSLDKVRKAEMRERRTAGPPHGFSEDFIFARKGRVGERRSELTDDDLRRYAELEGRYGLHLY